MATAIYILNISPKKGVINQTHKSPAISYHAQSPTITPSNLPAFKAPQFHALQVDHHLEVFPWIKSEAELDWNLYKPKEVCTRLIEEI
ncbi:hypothetical protein V2J09_006714 [Rumex salicifolius]